VDPNPHKFDNLGPHPDPHQIKIRIHIKIYELDPDPDPHHFDNLDPHPHQPKIRIRILIWIRIKIYKLDPEPRIRIK
jgi:hypothetical protein